MANALIRSSQVGGNKPIATFTREGLELGVQPISEKIILKHIGVIAANTPYTLDLSNLEYAIRLNSFYAIDVNATNTYVITIQSGVVKINEWSIPKIEIPFVFSDNLIVPDFSVTITPVNAISGIILYAQQNWFLQELLV